MDAHIYKNKIAKDTNIILKKINDLSALIKMFISSIRTKIKKMNEKEIHPPINPIINYHLGWRKDA
jgi:hypothetical protein